MSILKELIFFALISLIPRVAGSDHLRASMLRLAGCKIGKNVKVKQGIILQPLKKCHNVTIGDNTFINTNLRIGSGGAVTIGNSCAIGPNVSIETAGHSLETDQLGRRSTYFKPVIIEDNVWVGVGAIILPGVSLGKNCVVAAGSVVTKNVCENTLAGGVPAKTLKIIS